MPGFQRQSFFFFNDTAPPEIYTLSLHDALPISRAKALSTPGLTTSKPNRASVSPKNGKTRTNGKAAGSSTKRASCNRASAANCGCWQIFSPRSEEHTSELQSRPHLVCRLLLEKK